jgi:hypothetical protein
MVTEKKFSKTVIIPAPAPPPGQLPAAVAKQIAKLAKRLRTSGTWVAVLVALVVAAWIAVATARRSGPAHPAHVARSATPAARPPIDVPR